MSNIRDPAVGSCKWAGLWLKCGSLGQPLLHARARSSLQRRGTNGERAPPGLSGPCPKIDALGVKHGPDCPRLAIRGEPAGTAGSRVPRCTVVAPDPVYNWSCYNTIGSGLVRSRWSCQVMARMLHARGSEHASQSTSLVWPSATASGQAHGKQARGLR